MARKTRSANTDNILGICSELNSNQLPTNADVLKNYLYFRRDDNKFQNNKKYMQDTADTVQNIWMKTKIPNIDRYSIIRKVEKLYKSYVKVTKMQNKQNFYSMASEFRNKLESELFDISICKCNSDCKCSYELKVPLKEREFLFDQRNSRQMILLPSNQHENISVSQYSSQIPSPVLSPNPKRKKNNETALRKPIERLKPSTLQTESILTKHVNLSNVVRERQRYNISTRATATILNAFVKDLDIPNKDNIIDRNKIIRQTSKYNTLCEKTHMNNIIDSLNQKPYFGLFFDGKKDKTSVFLRNENTSQNHLRSKIEEHYSLVLQPDNLFYAHVSPPDGTAKSIAQTIHEKVVSDKISLNKMMFIGCDGTNVNVGHNNGAIYQIERKIGHAVHWSVCLLHFNELPLRELFIHLDGVTIGPKQFSGSIGKLLVSCEERPVKTFKKVFSDDLPVWPQNAVNDLSVDQRYLYQMCHSIQTGIVDSSLAMKNPGTMVHSRFLTTANRILRYYVSVSIASVKLTTLVNFIIKVYAPMWFTIKANESFKMGPKHIFKFIELVRNNVESKLREKIFNVVARNGYFAHAENILLSMLTDDDLNIRKNAVESILQAKDSAKNAHEIRKFTKPKIDFKAAAYFEMVDIRNTVPPIAQFLSTEQLKNCIENVDNWLNNAVKGIPNHTQAVERSIKLVSSVSSQVVGESNRNQKIYSTIASRALLPKANSKKDYDKYMKD